MRRQDLDGLRVLATGGVFAFHCAKYFDADGWHLTHPPPVEFFRAMVHWMSLWLMPLFFLLSGSSTRLALEGRDRARLLRDRVKRLLLPWAFGTLVIVPPQTWAEWVAKGRLNVPWIGNHLWYLLLLFLMTALLLWPLPFWFRLDRLLASRFGLFLPVIVCWLVEWAIAKTRLDNRSLGGWWPVQYVFFFLIGALLPKVKRPWPWLLAGLVCATLWTAAPAVETVPIAVWRLLRAVGAWGVLYGALGLAERWLHQRAWIAPLNEAAMPFYIFHQTVIVLLALPLLSWDTSAFVIYPVLVALALAVTAVLTLGVLHAQPLRPLFGLKTR